MLMTSLLLFTAGPSASRATGQAAATATAAAANPITPAKIRPWIGMVKQG